MFGFMFGWILVNILLQNQNMDHFTLNSLLFIINFFRINFFYRRTKHMDMDSVRIKIRKFIRSLEEVKK